MSNSELHQEEVRRTRVQQKGDSIGISLCYNRPKADSYKFLEAQALQLLGVGLPAFGYFDVEVELGFLADDAVDRGA